MSAPSVILDASGQPLGQAAPDPQAQRIAELERELAEVKGLCDRQKARLAALEVEMLVSLAIDEGKMLPEMRPWAMGLGRKDAAALKTFIAESPILAGRGQS